MIAAASDVAAVGLDRDLRDRLRGQAHGRWRSHDGAKRLAASIDKARADGIHLDLGFASWTAYAADVIDDHTGELPAEVIELLTRSDSVTSGLSLEERAERDARILQLSADNVTVEKIAEQVGCTERTVYNVRKAALTRFDPSAPKPFQVMPPLTGDEADALEDSIREHGVLNPIIVDPSGTIIEGHNRAVIAHKLGVECPRQVRQFADDIARRTAAYELNTARRALTREQKRQLVAQSITADPGLSDRLHARRCGVDHKTAAKVRDDLAGRGEIPHVETRTDSAGREQPSAKPKPIPEPPQTEPAATVFPAQPAEGSEATGVCAHCGDRYPVSQLYDDPGGHACEHCVNDTDQAEEEEVAGPVTTVAVLKPYEHVRDISALAGELRDTVRDLISQFEVPADDNDRTELAAAADILTATAAALRAWTVGTAG